MSVRALKHFCVGPPQYGLNTPASEYVDDGLRFLRTTDINEDGSVAKDSAVYVAPSLVSGRHELRQGDLLLSRSGSLGRCLRYTSNVGPATFAGYLVRFRPKPDAEPRYLEYCTRAATFQQTIEAEAVSSTISNFNAERYANLAVDWYPLAEQRAIADYLDIETARIDALIAKKRRMIELLGERAQAGIEFLLWSGPVAPLKHCGSVLPGYAFASTDFAPDGDGARLIRGINVGVGRIAPDDSVFLTRPATHGERRYLLRTGDVLVGMDRPFIKGGTRIAIAGESEDDALLVQRVCRIRPLANASPVLIAAALRSPRFSAYIEADLTGVSVPHLSDEQIRNYLIPESSFDSGDARARAIELEQSRFERFVAPLARQINLLGEHRQALITAAVTGSIPTSVFAP